MKSHPTSVATFAVVPVLLLLLAATPTFGGPTTTPASPPSAASVLGRWGNLSRVLDRFGEMTVTTARVRWASGQSSRYEVLAEDDKGVLLHLTANPAVTFHGTPCRYLRLWRHPDEGLNATTAEMVEASFFETHEQAAKNEGGMWGVYLPPET